MSSRLNPLFRLEQVEQAKLLPVAISNKIRARMKYVEEGVSRVERASGLKYPPHYVNPVLQLTQGERYAGEVAVLYAKIVPQQSVGGLELSVELSAPLVAFGSKATLHAVLAHEFMHYVEFVRKFIRMEALSDEVATTVFEAYHADAGRLAEARVLFKDKPLIKLVEKRFGNGLIDEGLNRKTARNWIEKRLPAVRISPESNIVKIPVSLILKMQFDPLLKMKIDELERLTLG